MNFFHRKRREGRRGKSKGEDCKKRALLSFSFLFGFLKMRADRAFVFIPWFFLCALRVLCGEYFFRPLR